MRGIEQRCRGLFALEVALADLADLGGRKLEGTDGLELVPNFSDGMCPPIFSFLVFVGKLGKRKPGRWQIWEVICAGIGGALFGPCRAP